MANTKRKSKATINAPFKAKSAFAARGEVNSCGDWLALALKNAFRTKDGSFDLTAFKACLKENAIEAPNVDMERHDAIGRFRTCAGLMLRRRALEVGFVVIGGKKIAARARRNTEKNEGGRGGGINFRYSALCFTPLPACCRR